MRRRHLITVTAMATAATIAAGTGGAASAKSEQVMKRTCRIESFQQAMPNPTAINFGYVSCPKPFRKGLHYSAFTVTTEPAPGVPGAANGNFKNYYPNGTTRGTFEQTIVASSPTNLTYTGTVTYTGGTGKFKHVKGGGTIACTTTDGGAHKSCDVNTTLTGI
jgi:hypothetical protein